jgi:hypothetical protein
MDATMARLYREFSVWMRVDDKKASRFRCLEDLHSRLFCVQSADFYSLPITPEHLAQLDRQFVELLIEIDPLERCDWYGSVEEAICGHVKEFDALVHEVVAREKQAKPR